MKQVLKELFVKVILPVCIALFLFSMFKPVFTKDGITDYMLVWIMCGIPFGIRRMFLWLIHRGYDIGGTVGIIALNFIVGGIIGGVILIWRLVCAVFYLFKYGIEIIKIATGRIEVESA